MPPPLVVFCPHNESDPEIKQHLFECVRQNAGKENRLLRLRSIMAMLLAPSLSRLLVVVLVEIRLGHLGLKQTTVPGTLLTLPSLIRVSFDVR
ncbi:hypothetical protein [Parasitella parasitica]|uniref:Uncharacterized protein n=1 Tax=Parasitella parasitica TaxID=35722 RepID=A0A0B7N9Z0_9FUNG|nr:hypothetical protein [Parasitella parasitica]